MSKRKEFLKWLILALKISTELSCYSFCNILFIKLINLWLKTNPNQNYYKKCKNMYLRQIMSQKMPTWSKPKMDTAEDSAKHAQSKQQRHQNDAIDIVVVSSSPTPTISHTPPQCPHFRPREDKRPLGHER